MFSHTSAVRLGPDGGFVVEIGSDSFQGPGAHGGLTSAMLLRAMSARSPWQPRSVTIQFCAPAPAGTSEIAVQLLRKGAATTFLAAQLVHAGRVCVHAVASFGAPRATDLDAVEIEPPAVPPAAGLPRAVLDGGPVFLQHWEIRMAQGALPYSGAPESRFAAWIRAAEPEPVDPSLALAVLDVLPPAILPRASSFRPMASVSLSCHFLAALPEPALDPAEPLLVDVVSRVTHGGYSDQESRLFTPSGRVLAIARQLVAVIR